MLNCHPEHSKVNWKIYTLRRRIFADGVGNKNSLKWVASPNEQNKIRYAQDPSVHSKVKPMRMVLSG